jgi:hypothetical protein
MYSIHHVLLDNYSQIQLNVVLFTVIMLIRDNKKIMAS